MKSKIKKFINSKLFVFIITALVFSTIGVSAATYFPSNDVTYDNTESGLESTDVQGAIDELYNECFPTDPPVIPAADTILESVPIVTNGAGLYQDEYKEGRYIYKGKNINNYVAFNNEIWRIVSIEPDKTIKIMRNESIGEMVYDSTGGNFGSTDWSRPADLNTYLNGLYLTGILNSTAQNQIVDNIWSIGSATWINEDITAQVNDENSSKWNGKVGLITASEYIRSNSDKNNCGTAYQLTFNKECINTMWMYKEDMWTLTSYPGNMFVVFPDGTFGGPGSPNSPTNVYPVVYLSSEIQIVKGDGSQSHTFEIE